MNSIVEGCIMTVSQRLEPLVHSGDFVSLERAWLSFLHYLKAGQGPGLRGDRQLVETALDFLESGGMNQEVKSLRSEWFAGFERRPDVVQALDSFLGEIGLSWFG